MGNESIEIENHDWPVRGAPTVSRPRRLRDRRQAFSSISRSIGVTAQTPSRRNLSVPLLAACNCIADNLGIIRRGRHAGQHRAPPFSSARERGNQWTFQTVDVSAVVEAAFLVPANQLTKSTAMRSSAGRAEPPTTPPGALRSLVITREIISSGSSKSRQIRSEITATSAPLC